MTAQEVVRRLKRAGIPIAYLAFTPEEKVKPPYMIYATSGEDGISSDDEVFGEICNYRVELYMRKKDYALEKKIKKIIGEIDSKYTSDETYISEEKLIEKIFEFETEEEI